MQPIAGDPELLHHYSVLIYPFLHHITGRQRDRRLASLEPRWTPWASRFTEHDLASTLEATSFFLPYIRGILYPDVLRLQEETPTEDPAHWARLLHDWSAADLADYGSNLPAAGVVRLTLRPGLMAALAEMIVVHQGFSGGYTTEAMELSAECRWIDAVLFPSGLGFLLLQVRLAQEQPRMSALIRLNQALRHVHPPRHSAHMPVLRLPGGEEVTVRDLMNFLTQGLAGPWTIPEEDRGIFPAPPAAASDRPYTDSEAGRGYGERCHLVSYGCVDLSGFTPAELPAGVFASATDRLLFEYGTCIGLAESVNNPVWMPSSEQAARLERDNRLALWRCWTGMVLKESLVFLATEDLGFTRRSLPRTVENDYLALYLFALYQKLQLFTFATDLMHEVAHACGQLRGARALAQRFVAFRSQYWFSEVTRKPQGGDLYRTFQRGLEVQSSYDLVTSSIKDVKDFYEGVWTRQLQLLKDVVTYGGPATMAFGAVRMIVGDSPHTWTIGGLIGLGAALMVLLRVCLRGVWSPRRATPARARGRNSLRFWRPKKQLAPVQGGPPRE
jgi:hypothetical protein